MLEVIQEILTAVVSSSSKDEESGYVFIPQPIPENTLNDGYGSAQISKEIFPSDLSLQELPNSQNFLDACQNIIRHHSPKTLILCPPLIPSRDLHSALRREFPKIDLPSIVLQKAIQLLSANALLIIILPQNFGSSHRDAPIREFVLQNTNIEYVISLRKDYQLVSACHHSMAFCILIFEVGTPNKIPTKFFKLPSKQTDVDNTQVLTDFVRLTKQNGGQTQYGYVCRKELAPTDKIIYEKYHPSLLAKQAAVGDYGSSTTLKDICQLKVGPINTTHSARNLIIDDTQTGTPVIDGREIRKDGSLQVEETRYRIKESEAANKHLNIGDICIRKIVSSIPQLIFAEVTADMPPLVASDKVIVMTVNPDTSPEDRELILAFLASDFPSHWLTGEGVHLWLYPSLLESLPVPLLDEDLKNACKSLSEAANQFHQWKIAAEQARSSLFEFGMELDNIQDSRLLLLQAGRDIRQRQEAAKLVDNFDYRVRTRFPYPIAYKWSTVKSAYPDLEGYVHILECAEIVVCYIAQVCIMVTHHIGITLGYVKSVADKLTERSSGISMGDWVAILQEANRSKNIQKYSDRIPFYEFTVFFSTEVASLIDNLQKRRNDNAHGRGPKGAQVVKAYQQALQELETLLSLVEFLSEYGSCPLLVMPTMR